MPHSQNASYLPDTHSWSEHAGFTSKEPHSNGSGNTFSVGTDGYAADYTAT